MEPDLTLLEARARRAYETSRGSHALLAALPVLATVALACTLGQRFCSALLLGAVLYGAGVVFLWRGRELGRAVLPGALAGIIPLSAALLAQHLGHVCMPHGCMSWCIPACTGGGVLAGLAIAYLGRRQPLRFAVGASFIALTTGALGCSCAGLGGITGLALGLGAVLPVARWRRR